MSFEMPYYSDMTYDNDLMLLLVMLNMMLRPLCSCLCLALIKKYLLYYKILQLPNTNIFL